MNTPPPRSTPSPTPSVSPDAAPTAPPLIPNLLRRRKTQFLLRRRNLGTGFVIRSFVEDSAGESVSAPADSTARADGHLEAIVAELEREREQRRGAEVRVLAADARAAALEADLSAKREELLKAEQRFEDAQRQIEEAKAFVQRARADMEHQRKRFQKEREELQATAAEDTLRKLFPVLDNFTYAIELTEQGKQDHESLAKGMVMVFRELKLILARLGLEPIAEKGIPFNPHIHDAVSAVEDSELPAGLVAAILRPGYQLGPKVLRPAMVSVTKAAPARATPVAIEEAPIEPGLGSETVPPIDQPGPETTTAPPAEVEERLSGLTPLDRARRMLDTKF